MQQLRSFERLLRVLTAMPICRKRREAHSEGVVAFRVSLGIFPVRIAKRR